MATYYVLVVLAAVLILGASRIHHDRRRKQASQWPIIDADVLNYVTENEFPRSYGLKVKYFYDNREYSAWASSDGVRNLDVSIGQRVKIRVNPNRPYDCRQMSSDASSTQSL